MESNNLVEQRPGGLYLVGFMGSGKTSVGGILANLLLRDFIDLDQQITAVAGRSIPAIFQEDGEPAFRKYEREVLETLPTQAVVALGGGAFIQPEIRAYIKKTGLAVFLNWPFQVLASRVSGDKNRPLASDLAAMKRLYEERLPVYMQADRVWTSETLEEKPTEIAQGLFQWFLAEKQP